MKGKNQQGSVLIVSLLLLLVITIVGVAGVMNSMTSERVAANQRQTALAFMAAESGLVNTKVWLDNNRNMWGEHDESMTALSSLYSTTESGTRWWIESLEYLSGLNNIARVVSCGTVAASGVERCVSFSYMQAKGATKLAALSLIGQEINFSYKNPNNQETSNISFNGGDDGYAIALNNDSSAEYLMEIKEEYDDLKAKYESDPKSLSTQELKRYNDLLKRYAGGIETVDFGDPFSSPEKLEEFVQSVKGDFCSCRTTVSYCIAGTYDVRESQNCDNVGFYNIVPKGKNKYEIEKDIGNDTSPKLVYVESTDPLNPLEIDLTLQGNQTGSGIFIARGNVSFSGTDGYKGLLLVLGGSFSISGGGTGGVNGALVVTNLTKNADNSPEFGNVDVSIGGGGTSEYFYNEARLIDLHKLLLSDATKPLWKVEDETGASSTEGSIFGWREVF